MPTLSRHHTEWRFLQLTGFILLWLLLSPLFSDRWVMQALIQLMLLNMVFVTLWANPQWQRIKIAVIALWVASVVGSLLAYLPLPAQWQRLGRTAELATLIPVVATCAAGILWFAFRSRRPTVDGLFATVAAYLLIAIAFAQAYLLLLHWDPDSFHLPVPALERSIQSLNVDVVYFSLVTLATVGYGDILPSSDLARTLAVIEAVVGQFYIAVLVAVFVGMYASRPQGSPEE